MAEAVIDWLVVVTMVPLADSTVPETIVIGKVNGPPNIGLFGVAVMVGSQIHAFETITKQGHAELIGAHLPRLMQESGIEYSDIVDMTSVDEQVAEEILILFFSSFSSGR